MKFVDAQEISKTKRSQNAAGLMDTGEADGAEQETFHGALRKNVLIMGIGLAQVMSTETWNYL
jgi:hypothetical protein